MKAKIKVVGKQVKDADQEEGRRRRKASRALDPHPTAEMLRAEEQEAVSIRAKEFRNMAKRLRFEAMLLDVAAKGEEERAARLSEPARRVRKWRPVAGARNPSNQQEIARSISPQ